MILSMTGHGRSRVTSTDPVRIVSAEIKALNSRGFEFTARLPRNYEDKEFEIRTILAKSLERGKISLTVTIESENDISAKIKINVPLLKSYYADIHNISEELQLDTEDILPFLFNLPNVMESPPSVSDDELWKQIVQAVREAGKELTGFRMNEGKNLEKDVRLRIKNILSLLKKIEPLEKKRIPVLRSKLTLLIKSLKEKIEIDRDRLEQELIYFSEKSDFTEEKVRLRSHCEYFLETLDEPVSNGKRLSFISQEIGREVNTLGSKANLAQIQKYVVQMKEELEKIKEQLLNII